MWDDDAIRQLLLLHQVLPHLTNLTQAIRGTINPQRTAYLLLLGLDMHHWLFRFLIYVLRGQSLVKIESDELYIAEHLAPAQHTDYVGYMLKLNERLKIIQIDSRLFTALLTRKWRRRPGRTLQRVTPMSRYQDPKSFHQAAIFLSYKREDRTIAERLRSQLVKEGFAVWFDRDCLPPGVLWDNVIREAVTHRCCLFFSLISEASERPSQGYFLLERNLAMDRKRSFAQDTPFYVPVFVEEDETGVAANLSVPPNEPVGTAEIQGCYAPRGQLDEEALRYFRNLVLTYCQRNRIAAPPDLA